MTEGRREPPSERPSEPHTGPAPARTARRAPPFVPPSERPSAAERVGPLLVERHRKADGRALILYREAPGGCEAVGGCEAAGGREARGSRLARQGRSARR